MEMNTIDNKNDDKKAVVVVGLERRFGDFLAVDSVSFEVFQKERFSDSLGLTEQASLQRYACSVESLPRPEEAVQLEGLTYVPNRKRSKNTSDI